MGKIPKKTSADHVLTTKESCFYLRITKPTFFKYIREKRIKATKAGKGWKVLKSDLDRFLRGGSELMYEASFCPFTADMSTAQYPSVPIRYQGWGNERWGERRWGR